MWQQAQEALSAEKEHVKQYRGMAEAAEGEREEQLRLSAEVKAAHDANLKAAEEAREEALRQLQATRAGKANEAELRSQLEGARAAVVSAEQKAQAAGEEAQEAATAKAEAAAAADAAVAALRVELAAAKEGEERAHARYRSELANHSYDMGELSSAKQAQVDAETAREAAEVKAAELAAELEALRVTFEESGRASSEQASGGWSGRERIGRCEGG
ncbi:MAG: hypothetical protein SGPRY_002834 [Prymnesium sp.]